MKSQAVKFLIIAVLFATACRPFPHDHYENERLSFNIADDFFIRRPKTFKRNNSTYIKVVNKDLKLYSEIIVTWLPGEQDLDKELKNFQESLTKRYSSEIYNPAFGLIMNGKFASNETRRFEYFVNNDPRKGAYQAFHCNGLTVIIGQHYFHDTEEVTKKCLKVIEESFTCK